LDFIFAPCEITDYCTLVLCNRHLRRRHSRQIISGAIFAWKKTQMQEIPCRRSDLSDFN
jgi:hypothetical protein